MLLIMIKTTFLSVRSIAFLQKRGIVFFRSYYDDRKKNDNESFLGCLHPKFTITKKKSSLCFKPNRNGCRCCLFIYFLAIASIPGLIDQLTSNQVDTNIEIHPFFLLIFFFIFYYLIILLVVFTGISIIAYLGTLFATQTNRKLQFGLMWKMTAFAT